MLNEKCKNSKVNRLQILRSFYVELLLIEIRKGSKIEKTEYKK